jgi:hypothetical protein
MYSGPKKTGGRRQTADRKSSIIILKMIKMDLNFKQKSPLAGTVSTGLSGDPGLPDRSAIRFRACPNGQNYDRGKKRASQR